MRADRPFRRPLAGNLLLNSLGLGLPIAIALVCIPPLIERLGMPLFGLLTLVWVVLGYFSVFDLGIGRALTLAVAQRRATCREASAPVLVAAAVLLTAALGAAGAGLLASLADPLARLIAADAPKMAETARLSLWVVAGALPFVTMTAALRGTLEAYERFDLTSAIRVGMGVLTYGGPLVVLHFVAGVLPVVLFLAAARVLAWAIHLAAVRRMLPSASGWHGCTALRELRPLVALGGWMTVSNVVSPLLTYLDRFVVATIVGLAAIAYYTTPYEAVIRLTVVPEAVLGVLFPAMVAAVAADRAIASALYACTLRALLAAMTVIATAGVAFAAPLLGAWISPAFAAGSQHVLQILVVGVAINAVAWVPFSAIQSQGRADLTARLHLAELPIFLSVLYALTQAFGVIGAAFAWTLRASADFALLLAIQHRLMPTAYRMRTSTVVLVPSLWVVAWAVHDHAHSPWRAVLAWLVVAAAVAVAVRGIMTPDDRAAAIGAARQLAGRVGRQN